MKSGILEVQRRGNLADSDPRLQIFAPHSVYQIGTSPCFDIYALSSIRAKNWRSHSTVARAASPALICLITGWISWHFMKVFQQNPVR